MKLIALRAHWLADCLQPVGSVYEASEADARLLVSLGKAAPAPADPPQPEKPKRAARPAAQPKALPEPVPAQAPEPIEKDPENA